MLLHLEHLSDIFVPSTVRFGTKKVHKQEHCTNGYQEYLSTLPFLSYLNIILTKLLLSNSREVSPNHLEVLFKIFF